MSLLYIEELSGNGLALRGPIQAPQQPAIATQVLDYTSGAAQSAAFNANTRLVRLHCDTSCSRLFGVNPTATTTSPRMAAGDTEYHCVDPDNPLKVSVITNS